MLNAKQIRADIDARARHPGYRRLRRSAAKPNDVFVTSVAAARARISAVCRGRSNCQNLARHLARKSYLARLSQHPSTATTPGSTRSTHRPRAWQNAKCAVIATDIENLHGANNITSRPISLRRALWSTARRQAEHARRSHGLADQRPCISRRHRVDLRQLHQGGDGSCSGT